jgi:hypothetical protein
MIALDLSLRFKDLIEKFASGDFKERFGIPLFKLSG